MWKSPVEENRAAPPRANARGIECLDRRGKDLPLLKNADAQQFHVRVFAGQDGMFNAQ